MRSGPVNLAATRAAPELLVINPGKGLELFNYFSLAYFLERCIAAKATRKRIDGREKVKTANDLDRLFVSILGTRIIAVFYDGMHEQVAIARKQGAVLAFHYIE